MLIDPGHNANRYTFVRGRAIHKSKERIQRQLKVLWTYAEQVAKKELQNNEPEIFEKIDAEKVSQTIEKIEQALERIKIEPKVRQKLNYVRKRRPEALDKCMKYGQKMRDRISLSRTDP